MSKILTEKEERLNKARLFLNKNFKLGWNMKWKNTDDQVKALAKLLKHKS